jgi:hypothetical protein
VFAQITAPVLKQSGSAMSTSIRETHPSGSLPKEIFGYEIPDIPGRGAGATLYVACDPHTGQLYALKHSIRQTEKDIRFIAQVKCAGYAECAGCVGITQTASAGSDPRPLTRPRHQTDG